MSIWRLAMPALLVLLGALPAVAQEPAKLRVNVFAGVQNLAIFVGQAKGVFKRHGLDVELQFTPNSPTQREGLAKGAFEIAHAGVDNSVALAETGAGSIIVMGGDRYVRPVVLVDRSRSKVSTPCALCCPLKVNSPRFSL
jgi:ABC-type nitrate/sulfonate/bicarbonate transport system substrate-binding protein